MRTNPNKWRALLDPRDPDYLDDEQESSSECDGESDYFTDDELDEAASRAEGK